MRLRRSRRRWWAATLALVLLAVSAQTSRAAHEAGAGGDDSVIVHLLNRLAYGPRPGEVERVRAIGLRSWIEQQLDPPRIPDPAVGPRLARLETLSLTSRELLAGYEVPREARREIAARRAELESAGEEEMRAARRQLMRKYAGRMEGPPRQVLSELQEATLLRAVYGERQLEEVLVDFWLNHFNVFAQKGPVKFLLGEYEREVLRPRAWGKFEDLLLATAESPAMLFYLDNWLSADPDTRPPARGRRGGRRGRFGPGRGPQMRRAPEGAAQGRKRGLNENYAREIMELHTLGVDGGYTQKDVTEVARCFTGWTIKGLREGRPEFHFEPRFHAPGDKVVLGRTIKGGGQDEGRKVIHLLATHPSTPLDDIRDFALRPGAGPAVARGFEEMYAGAARDVLHGTGRETFEAIDFLQRADPARYRPAPGVRYPRGPYGESLRQIAQLIKADVGLEMAFTDVGGWDHHAAEGGVEGQLAGRLREFGAALAAFHRDLGERMADVVLVSMTEFGRTVRENGNRGTDHGHASVSFVLGGPIQGGRVYGRWPGLGAGQLYEGRDLALTTDFRDLLGELLVRHLGTTDLGAVFPGHAGGRTRFPGVLSA